MGLSHSLCGNRSHISPPLESYSIDDIFSDSVLPLPEAASSQSLCQKSYRIRSHSVHHSSSSTTPSSAYRSLNRRVKSHSSNEKQYFEDTDESSVETNSPASLSDYRGHFTFRYDNSKLQLHTRVPSTHHKPSSHSVRSSSFSSPSSSERSPESVYNSIYYQETDHEGSGEEGCTPRRPIHRSYDDNSVRLWIPQTNSTNFSQVQQPSIRHSRSQASFTSSNTPTLHESRRAYFIPRVQSHGSLHSIHSTSMVTATPYPHSITYVNQLNRSLSTHSFDPSDSNSSLESLDEEEPLEELEETCATITPMCELASPESCPRTAFSFMRSISHV